MYKDKFKKNTIRTSSGFTLIETLVAIFILVLATTGPLSFAQSGLRASFVARDQVVAFYLAQDAIETIKNLLTKWFTKMNFQYAIMHLKARCQPQYLY
jgi:prepilin-type N-terminal cleavage/methylation domain-containing protein